MPSQRLSLFFFIIFLVLTLIRKFIKTPVGFGGVLIILRLIASIILGLSNTTWYGYLLFLVYVGGLLVLFLYVIIISRNFFLKRLANPILSFSFIFIVILFIFHLGQISERIIWPKGVIRQRLNECRKEIELILLLRLAAFLFLVFFATIHIVLIKGKIIQSFE